MILFLLATILPWEGHEPPPLEPAQEITLDPNLLNLESYEQDFIVETKEIIIPGYAKAFNPAIVRYNDSTLLSFRLRDEQGISTFQIGLIWLDDQFNPVGTAQVLDIPHKSSAMFQDPRFVVVGDKFYMFFSNLIEKKPGDRDIRRMYYTELLYDGTTFTALEPICLRNFEGESSQRWEKNWAPFDYMGNLLFTYSLLPHRIMSYNDEMESCDTLWSTTSSAQWDWGVLRGGTPPLLEDGQYLAFFHSCKNIPTVQSRGKNITHYVFGAYTFSPEPPFELTAISPYPIIDKNFYSGPPHNTWKPLRVVFPCGHISDGEYLYLAYGRQDHECWIAKIDKQKLLDSLVPVY